MDEDEDLRADHPGSDLELGRRIAHVIKLLGEDKAAHVTDKSVRTLQRYERGAEPPASVIKALSQAAEVPTEWLLFGGSPTPPSPSGNTGYIAVPRFPVRASAGHGAVASELEPASAMMFRADWLRKIGVSLRNSHVITVTGSSMEPTLYEGDVVLVDAGDNKPVPGALFALVIDDSAFIKRIQLQSDGSVILISDNKTLYRDETIPRDRVRDLRIIGRVRWFGRAL